MSDLSKLKDLDFEGEDKNYSDFKKEIDALPIIDECDVLIET